MLTQANVTLILSGLLTCSISFLIALVICLIFRWSGAKDSSVSAVQSAHSTPTPRLGGLSILGAILFSIWYFGYVLEQWFFFAVLPIFILGFFEDLHFKTPPKIRLCVGILCAALGVYFSGVTIKSLDIAIFDEILSIVPISIAFTVFAVVGMTNAINLIDGVNGLASGISIVSSLALFLIAAKYNEESLLILCVLLASGSLGLFFLNFPKGKIFMGDAGSYSVGFVIAWLLILLADRHPEISKWSLLATAFWPVMDTVYAIFRRRLKKRSPEQPDMLHFHQLVMRGWEILSYGKMSRRTSNPLATFTILPLTMVPAFLGVYFIDSHWAGLTVVILSAFGYVFLYNFLFQILVNEKKRKIFSSMLRPIWACFDGFNE